MANNRIQVKRTNTTGRTPNTTNSGNSQYIAAGEFALNMVDGILYSSNGSALITVGANQVNQNVSNTLTVKAISANGSNGTSGQVLYTNGTATYWNSPTYGSLNYAQNAAPQTWANNQTGTVTLAQVTITTSGNPVQIIASGDANPLNAGGWGRLQLWRGSTAIGAQTHFESSGANENVPYSLQFIDAPATGTYTYSIRSNYVTGNTQFGETDGPVISVVELQNVKGANGDANTARSYTWTNTHSFGNLVSIQNSQKLAFIPNAGGANAYFTMQNDDNFVLYSTSSINEPRAVWSIFNNSDTSALSVATPLTLNGNLTLGTVAVSANGSTGTSGQVLTTNGSSTYWSSAAAGVNVNATYAWSNVHTFAANVGITAAALGLSTNTTAIYFNGTGDVNWKMGRNTSAFTKWKYTNNSVDIAVANSNLEGFTIGNAINPGNSFFETGYLGTFIASNVTIGNTSVNATINSTAFTGTSNNTSYVGSVTAANVVSNAQLSGNLANYQTTAGLSANVATLTANNTSFVGSVSAANVVSNAQLSGNLANYQTTAGLSANVATLTSNNSTYFAGYTWSAPALLGGTSANGASLTYANVSGQINTATLYATTSANIAASVFANSSGLYPSSNTIALGNTTARWVINANTINGTGDWTTTGNVGIGAAGSSTVALYTVKTWASDADRSGLQTSVTDSNTAVTSARTKYNTVNLTYNYNQNKSSDGLTSYASQYFGQYNVMYNGNPSTGGDANAAAMTGTLNQIINTANGANANSLITGRAAFNLVQQFGSNTINLAEGTRSRVQIGNSSITGNITTAYAHISDILPSTGATIDTGYLYYGGYGAGNVTTKYGLFITNEANNYFSANLSVGGAINVSSGVAMSYANVTGQVNTATLYATTSANVGANVQLTTTTIKVGNTNLTTTNAVFGGTIAANGGIGSTGQVLISGGAANAYWASIGNGTVTSVASGNGITGGTITGSGTLYVTEGSGLSVNSTGVHVKANNGIVSNSTGTFAKAANGISVDSSGINVVAGNTQLVSNTTGVWIDQTKIDHNSLSNYDANKHVDHTAVSITAGSGLTGGGTIAASRTIDVGAGNGISVAADAVYVNGGSTTTVNTTGVHVNSTLSLTTLTTTGNATIGGNLTINGNVTVIGANNLSIVDNMIYLNSNSTTSNVDLGFAGNYNDGTYKHAGFFRDASDGYWKPFDGYTPEPDAAVDIDTSNITFNIAGMWFGNTRIGNTTVYATVNSTVYSGTANNSTNFGGYTWAAPGLLGSSTANGASFTYANVSGQINTATLYTTGMTTFSSAATQSNTSAAAWFSGGTGAIGFDTYMIKRISWNDGAGNFNIRAGHYYNGTSTVYVNDGTSGGAASIIMSSDAADGVITFTTYPIGTQGATVSGGASAYLNTSALYVSANIYAGSLLVANSTVVNATHLAGYTLAAPSVIGSGTANGATFTYANVSGQVNTATFYATTSANVGANVQLTTSTIKVGNTTLSTTNAVFGGTIAANGGIGTAGYGLFSGGAANAYWSTVVTSVASGNGITGGTITQTGTLYVSQGDGVSVNTTGVHVKANTGIVANATGTYVNAAYIATIASNSATYANASVTNTFTVGTASYFVANGNLGVGTASPSYTLQVNGSFAATTKSFLIDHPTKPDMKLRYGSLEGPENGIYVRGKLEESSTIELPDYWWNLIDPESITVNLTPYGGSQDLWVQSTSAYIINLNQPANCYFTVFAERKDVEKLVVEF